MIHYIFGKPIQLKTYCCSVLNKKETEQQYLSPYVNLFIKITDKCNCRCKFCSSAATCHNQHKTTSSFDYDKLLQIIEEIKSHHINVNKINLTGGEPALYPDVVKTIADIIPDDIHLHLNTNGLTKSSQILMRDIDRIDSISMSVHHYNIEKLKEIYNVSEISFPNDMPYGKLNISCNLIKSYIDSESEVEKMLDFADEHNIYRIGFVGLMKVNDFCKEHFINPKDINFSDIPGVVYTKSMCRDSICSCHNYMRNNLEIYWRCTYDHLNCESSLLFDGQHLYHGFSDNNIII